MNYIYYSYFLFIPMADFIFASQIGLFGINIVTIERDIYLTSLFLFGLLSITLMRNCFIKNLIIIYYIFIFIYSLYSIEINTNINLIIKSAGTLIIPTTLFSIGYYRIYNSRLLIILFNSFISFCIITTLFGFYELNNTYIWDKYFNLSEYLMNVKGINIGLEPVSGLPWNFYKDINPDDGRRAAGIVAAPLAQAMILAFGLIASFNMFLDKNQFIFLILSILISIGLYTTGSRGGCLVAIIGVMVALWLNKNKYLSIVLIIILNSIIYWLFEDKILNTINLLDNSVMGHLNGFNNNLLDFHRVLIFGIGVGLSGANASNEQSILLGGGEGSIFSIAYQIGLPGLFLFLLFYYKVMNNIYIYNKIMISNKLKIISNTFLCCGVGFTVTFMTSEHLLTISGMSFFWLICGGLVRNYQNYNNNFLKK